MQHASCSPHSAETAFRRAVLLQPHDPKALTALGQVEEQRGEYTDAARAFREVIRLDGHSSEAHVNLAVTLADQGQLAPAMKEATTALRLSPQSSGAHFLRGRLLNDQGDRQGAAGEFRKALRLSPRDSEILRYWAELAHEQGDRHAEAGLLKQYLNLRATDAEAQFRYGQLMRDEGRTQDATSAWHHAVTLNPNYREALYSLARALKETDPSAARSLLARVALLEGEEHADDQVRLLGNTANEKMDQGDYLSAIEIDRQAIMLCGTCKYLGALDKNLGLAYCHKGELDACQRELKSAELLVPEDPDIPVALRIAISQQKSAGSSP